MESIRGQQRPLAEQVLACRTEFGDEEGLPYRLFKTKLVGPLWDLEWK